MLVRILKERNLNLNEEDLSDFLKIAYKYNKVKDLQEAFKEYPVEDECHKGKIENVIVEYNY